MRGGGETEDRGSGNGDERAKRGVKPVSVKEMMNFASHLFGDRSLPGDSSGCRTVRVVRRFDSVPSAFSSTYSVKDSKAIVDTTRSGDLAKHWSPR